VQLVNADIVPAFHVNVFSFFDACDRLCSCGCYSVCVKLVNRELYDWSVDSRL